MVTKDYILSEIRRTAAENGGQALGRARFEKETGIRETDWTGRYWVKWSDAIAEAGYVPNALQKPYPIEYLLEKLVIFIQELGHFPTSPELRLKARSDPTFPSHNVFSRLGKKSERAWEVLQYCTLRPGFDDVADICRPIASLHDPESESPANSGVEVNGFVYLMKSGKYYKIGRSVSPEKRAYEVQLLLPEQLTLVHKIRTDDPAGIEAYWHSRFADRRVRGEWFNLSAQDVKAFRRRKLM